MSESAAALSTGRAFALAVLSWVLPSAGHFALRRPRRAAVFALVIAAALVTGVALEGNLYRPVAGQPLSVLATLGAMGMGAPYFVLRHVLAYDGDATAAGYEYGTAFLLSAGLMNLLLVLDVWDLARRRKA